MLILFFLALALFSHTHAETLEEELACVDNMEVCRAQVTILINSLSNVESFASPGTVDYCDPAKAVAPSSWWVEQLKAFGVAQSDVDKLSVCDNSFWAYHDGNNYRSTCIAYENENFESPCPSSDYFCALMDSQYGYPSHIATALNDALATATKSHPQCPRGSCNPLDSYWKEIMVNEGISSADTDNLCTYDGGVLDQYYYVQDQYTVLNTCVVSGTVWDTDCNADKGRVCSGINDGQNVVGWPKQQARMVLKAMENGSKNHPQCTVQS